MAGPWTTVAGGQAAAERRRRCTPWRRRPNRRRRLTTAEVAAKTPASSRPRRRPPQHELRRLHGAHSPSETDSRQHTKLQAVSTCQASVPRNRTLRAAGDAVVLHVKATGPPPPTGMHPLHTPFVEPPHVGRPPPHTPPHQPGSFAHPTQRNGHGTHLKHLQTGRGTTDGGVPEPTPETRPARGTASQTQVVGSKQRHCCALFFFFLFFLGGVRFPAPLFVCRGDFSTGTTEPCDAAAVVLTSRSR